MIVGLGMLQYRTMGDNYLSAIKLFTCVQYVIDSISCEAAIKKKFALCHQC